MKRIITAIALTAGIAQAEQPQANPITLKRYVTAAQTEKFKVAYDTNLYTTEIKTELLDVALNTKTALQKEQKLLGAKKVHTGKLLIGAGQATVVLWALYNTYRVLKLCRMAGEGFKNVTMPTGIAKYLIPGGTLPFYFTKHKKVIHENPATGENITVLFPEPHISEQKIKFAQGAIGSLVGLGGIAAVSLKYARNNLKQGWNYKAHLENQIKNVDEIIAFIQNPTATAVTEELV